MFHLILHCSSSGRISVFPVAGPLRIVREDTTGELTAALTAHRPTPDGFCEIEPRTSADGRTTLHGLWIGGPRPFLNGLRITLSEFLLRAQDELTIPGLLRIHVARYMAKPFFQLAQTGRTCTVCGRRLDSPAWVFECFCEKILCACDPQTDSVSCASLAGCPGCPRPIAGGYDCLPEDIDVPQA